jgi:phenylacetate-CoA ligase
MGVWIGGLITYQAFKHISERGHPLTIITPGINKQEIFKAFVNLGKNFDQIILCGYPPFIKDIIDQAKDHGINLTSFNLRVIFAAESFSETFRDYVIQKIGGKDPYRTTMSIYGTADLGTMAFETPLCILLRRLALSNQVFSEKIFGQVARLPTLVQYLPDYISFESENGVLYGTGGTVLPLVRYDMGDNGGVLNYDQLLVLCSQSGINLTQEIKKAKIEDTLSQLPFVYVYERSDFSTKLYGAIIYPEYIKRGIQKN